MKKLIQEAIELMDIIKIKSRKITAGFDGCIDSICKVIRKDEGKSLDFFDSMHMFSAFIDEKSGMSCTIGLVEQVKRAGGNCPIFANAISQLGVNTTAIGLFGQNGIVDIFSGLQDKCKLFSYGDPASALALEFNDGKVIMYPKIKDEENVWRKFTIALGSDTLTEILLEADLLGFLNWAELPYSTKLWREISQFLTSKPDKTKHVLVDLADCSRSSIDSRNEILHLLTSLSKIRTVTLSLNENEAFEINKTIGSEESDIEAACRNIARNINVDAIVVHGSKSCCTVNAKGDLFSLSTRYNHAPKLLTGGGDNFNAGYAFGLLLEQRGEICNVFGNGVSSFYISHGFSPDLESLKTHMWTWFQSLTS